MILNSELLKKIKLDESNNLLQVYIYEDITQKENDMLEKYAKDKCLSLRMTLANLNDEQKDSLKNMRDFINEMESIPESEKEPIPKQILDRWQSEAG